jgi:4-methoxybenzoate monooxygenase (O-demethylating)
MSSAATVDARAPVLAVDPFSREFFENPHPIHEQLREAGPIVRLSRYGAWAVARYAEVHAMLNDWQTFSSARGVGLQDFAREKAWRPRSLVLETDPPFHDRTRRILTRVLSPPVMRRLRAQFEAAADALVDRLVERGRFDAVADLAEEYPLTVFPDAMGMPRENRRFLLPYGNMVFNSFGPDNEFFREAVKDAQPVLAWLQQQMQRESFAPGGFGAEIHAAVETGELTSEEAPGVARSLLTAGVDTTVSGIGAAVYCLARFPAQFARLRADPTLARAAFEEAVRFESPVQTFFRTTTRPVRIGEVEVGEGEKILMFLGAANRDPRQWERPEEFDVERRVSGHVGFGSGIHACVGQLLARLEGECVLSALARKVGAIEIDGEPRRRFNNTLRGLASLPVAVRPAAAR